MSRIAEKILERRAKRCNGVPEQMTKDAELAAALLRGAGVWAEWLLAGRGYAVSRACTAMAAAVERWWMDPRHALRFAHELIEEAVRGQEDER